MSRVSLSGTWEFRLDEEYTWRPIPVPSCWELNGIRKDHAGPVWYQTRFAIPDTFADRRIWLRFGAVSYHCLIFVDGQPVGEHTGMWDSFAVEITHAVRPGESAELRVRVEKPASLTAGPDSAPLPGRFLLRETLAGFLPYVWGHAFGGIWQDVELFSTGQVTIEDVYVRGEAEGRVTASVELSAPGALRLALFDPDGRLIYEEIAGERNKIDFSMQLPAPRPWSPRQPNLYTARLLCDGDERVVRFGLRSLSVQGAMLLLNRQPIYPRMALSWGWYADTLCPNPEPARVRADFERLKRLGYNGVKACLWFPPQAYFDLADQLGMLLWVELPMWLPKPTAFFREQTPREYDRLVRLARNHPSVILYTLGCELNREVGADVLQPLYTSLKAMVGDALVRDNSGSGEAYGGLLDEYADTYDHHFYSDLPYLRHLLEAFAPRWRPEKPWLFGEFCDYDTFRNLPKIHGAHSGDRPWWTSPDPVVNPQGARWEYRVVEHESKLNAEQFSRYRPARLEELSTEQGLLHRKVTIELIRAYNEVSGYVVTGEVDTPISTAGMWDDLGELKFDPDAFRAFNDDLVVLVGWDRRRAWIAGGDRAAHWDTYSYASGATVRAHLIASHYGRLCGPASVAWEVAFPGVSRFAAGVSTTSFAVDPGSVREVGLAEFIVPEVSRPKRALLRASVQVGGETAHNAWPLWFFPGDAWAGVEPFPLIDPVGRLRDLRVLVPHLCRDRLEQERVAVFTAWSPEADAFVREGGGAVVLQSGHGPAGPLPTREAPFWREAIKLIEPHPAWGDFPHDNMPGLQFYGCATDAVLDASSFAGAAAPIFRRLDARSLDLHDYVVELEWGKGHLIVSTLRLEGGSGDQPVGICRNTAAAYLLACWLRYLQRQRTSLLHLGGIVPVQDPQQ